MLILLKIWGWFRTATKFVVDRPWAQWGLALIGITAAYKAWKIEVQRQAREREMQRIALEHERQKSETIVQLKRVEDDIRERAQQAAEVVRSAGDVDTPDELQRAHPEAHSVLHPGSGDGDGASGRDQARSVSPAPAGTHRRAISWSSRGDLFK